MKHQAIEDYIHDYWDRCTTPAGTNRWGKLRNWPFHFGRIKLPYDSVSPNHDYFAGTQYYWDTYFNILGLVIDGRQGLAKGLVENLLFLFPKFGLFPARNSWTSIGRTQPPYLTRMAFEIYESGAGDKKWLDKVMRAALKEYETVWCAGRRFDTASGLSRYRPKYLKNKLATYESGWDTSSRFRTQGNDVIPVDLNCLLYQYEADFKQWNELKGNKKSAAGWAEAMGRRRAAIDKAFWDEKTGFYYDNCNGEPGRLKTVAGFFPMWCGAASKTQAAGCVKQLKAFLHKGGVAMSEPLPFKHWQWDYPNGWPTHNYIVYKSLERYGYKKEAQEVAQRWLDCNREVYAKTGVLWEKYDVVKCLKGKDGRYPTPGGFSWTNSIFIRLSSESGR